MTTLYLGIRVLHILMGALWVGLAVFVAFFLMPAVGDSGPEGGKVMAALERRRFVVYAPVVAALTVLSGLWLYWRYTAGFSATIAASHAGMAFGLGGALGIVSAVLGGAVLSRAAATATALFREAAGLPEGPTRAAKLASAQQFRARAQAVARLVAVLLIITVGLMSVAILI